MKFYICIGVWSFLFGPLKMRRNFVFGCILVFFFTQNHVPQLILLVPLVSRKSGIIFLLIRANKVTVGIKISKIQKNSAKKWKIFEIFSNSFRFSSHCSSKPVLQLNCFTMHLKYAQVFFLFRCFYHNMQRKTTPIWNKNFYKTVVGTFCATLI